MIHCLILMLIPNCLDDLIQSLAKQMSEKKERGKKFNALLLNGEDDIIDYLDQR